MVKGKIDRFQLSPGETVQRPGWETPPRRLSLFSQTLGDARESHRLYLDNLKLWDCLALVRSDHSLSAQSAINLIFSLSNAEYLRAFPDTMRTLHSRFPGGSVRYTDAEEALLEDTRLREENIRLHAAVWVLRDNPNMQADATLAAIFRLNDTSFKVKFPFQYQSGEVGNLLSHQPQTHRNNNKADRESKATSRTDKRCRSVSAKRAQGGKGHRRSTSFWGRQDFTSNRTPSDMSIWDRPRPLTPEPMKPASSSRKKTASKHQTGCWSYLACDSIGERVVTHPKPLTRSPSAMGRIEGQKGGKDEDGDDDDIAAESAQPRGPEAPNRSHRRSSSGVAERVSFSDKPADIPTRRPCLDNLYFADQLTKDVPGHSPTLHQYLGHVHPYSAYIPTTKADDTNSRSTSTGRLTSMRNSFGSDKNNSGKSYDIGRDMNNSAIISYDIGSDKNNSGITSDIGRDKNNSALTSDIASDINNPATKYVLNSDTNDSGMGSEIGSEMDNSDLSNYVGSDMDDPVIDTHIGNEMNNSALSYYIGSEMDDSAIGSDVGSDMNESSTSSVVCSDDNNPISPVLGTDINYSVSTEFPWSKESNSGMDDILRRQKNNSAIHDVTHQTTMGWGRDQAPRMSVPTYLQEETSRPAISEKVRRDSPLTVSNPNSNQKFVKFSKHEQTFRRPSTSAPHHIISSTDGASSATYKSICLKRVSCFFYPGDEKDIELLKEKEEDTKQHLPSLFGEDGTDKIEKPGRGIVLRSKPSVSSFGRQYSTTLCPTVAHYTDRHQFLQDKYSDGTCFQPGLTFDTKNLISGVPALQDHDVLRQLRNQRGSNPLRRKIQPAASKRMQQTTIRKNEQNKPAYGNQRNNPKIANEKPKDMAESTNAAEVTETPHERKAQEEGKLKGCDNARRCGQPPAHHLLRHIPRTKVNRPLKQMLRRRNGLERWLPHTPPHNPCYIKEPFQ